MKIIGFVQERLFKILHLSTVIEKRRSLMTQLFNFSHICLVNDTVNIKIQNSVKAIVHCYRYRSKATPASEGAERRRADHARGDECAGRGRLGARAAGTGSGADRRLAGRSGSAGSVRPLSHRRRAPGRLVHTWKRLTTF